MRDSEEVDESKKEEAAISREADNHAEKIARKDPLLKVRKRSLLGRFLLGVGIFVVVVHFALVLAVSLPGSQKWLLEKGTNYLEAEFGIHAEIQSVGVGILPPRLTFSGIQFELGPNQEGQPSPAAFSIPYQTEIELGFIEFGLSPLGLLGNPLSAFQDLTIGEVRIVSNDEKLFFAIEKWLNSKDDLQDESDEEGHFDFWSIYGKVLRQLPKRLRLENVSIEIGYPQALNYVSLHLESFNFINNRKDEQAVLIAMKQGVAKLESFPEIYELSQFNIEARLKPVENESATSSDSSEVGNGSVIFDGISVKATGLQLGVKGTAHTGAQKTESQPLGQIDKPTHQNVKGNKSYFKLNLDVEAEFETRLLALFDIQGKGIVRTKGKLEYSTQEVHEDVDPLQPTLAASTPFLFEGTANWEEVQLDNFQVYSGDAVFSIRGNQLLAPSIEIRTPGGGLFAVTGEVKLGDTFPFSASGRIQDMGFEELMMGLGVNTDVVQFQFGTLEPENLKVEGEGLLNDERIFRISFDGPLNVRGLNVPSITETIPEKHRLPDCRVNLKLLVDSKKLLFDSSTAECQQAESQEERVIRVDSGLVRFDDGYTMFNLSGNNVDLSLLSYFTKLEASGLADLKGQVKSGTAGKGVVFEAAVDAKPLMLGGFFFDKVTGNIHIGDSGLKIDKVSASRSLDSTDTNAQKETISVHSESNWISFNQSPSRFSGWLRGDLGVLASVYPDLPALSKLRGRIESARVDWRMDLNDLGVDQFSSQLDIKNLAFGEIFASSAQVDLDCGLENCTRGEVLIDEVEWGRRFAGNRPGNIFLNVQKLSENGILFSAKSSDVPTTFTQNSSLRTLFNADIEIGGQFNDWSGKGTVILRDLMFRNQPIGALRLDLSRNEKKPLNVIFSGFFDKLNGQVQVALNKSGKNSLDAQTRGLDLMFFLPERRTQNNLYSNVDASLELTTPSFFSDTSFLSDQWISEVQSKFTVLQGLVSTQGINVKLGKPVRAVLSRGEVKVDEFSLVSESSELAATLNYNFLTKSGRLKSSGEVSIGVLTGAVPAIEQSIGKITINAQGDIRQGNLNMNGEMFVNAQKIRVAGYEPAFENIEGSLLIKPDRIEVVKLGGSKGSGQFEILGSVVFPNEKLQNEGSMSEPDLGLRIRLAGIQSKIPVPIFRTVDAELSGNLELSGKSRPYDLRGVVVIDRLRAFRDITCEEIIDSVPKGNADKILLNSSAFVNLDINVDASESVNILTKCVRTKLSSKLRVQGTEKSPRFSGTISAESGKVQVLKAKFDVQRAEITFDSPITFDPRLDISLVAPIENYQVYMNLDGYSSAPRTSFWSEPSVTPSGTPVGQGEVLRMIASGRAPKASSGGEGSALASQVATYVYGTTTLDENLSKAFSKLTAGFVDTVRLQPIIENGQTTWKASVSRSVGDRFNLGLDVEQSPIVNNQSLTGTLFINETINVLGGFDRIANSTDSYYELSGGLRFSFGGK